MSRLAYVNEYLYFVVNREEKDGRESISICSGVNVDRFYGITKKRHGIGGNPISSGLQLVNFDICSLAITKGAVPRASTGSDCAGIAPTDETWYVELFKVTDANGLSNEEVVTFGVQRLVEKIVFSSRLNYPVPDRLLSPEGLQAYLEKLSEAVESSLKLKAVAA